MENGYDYISITQEKTPHHLGGLDDAEYKIDHLFFKNKNIILFDDIVTTGKSMRDFIYQLKNIGSNIILQLSIARTYNEYTLHKPIHPYTKNKGII